MTQANSRDFDFTPCAAVLELWNPALRASGPQNGTVIEIFDVIGEGFMSTGVTAKSVSAALKGAGDVVVNINSPGGNFFEGVTIYNLLNEHKWRVDVNVLGLAASAASVIAMAGDTVKIGKTASMMIHNARGIVVGTSAGLAKAAEVFSGFDSAMAELYAGRTGKPVGEVVALMNAETWMKGDVAVSNGFADSLLGNDAVAVAPVTLEETKALAAIRLVDAALAEIKMPRAARRATIKNLKSSGTPCAAESGAMPCAVPDPVAEHYARLLVALTK